MTPSLEGIRITIDAQGREISNMKWRVVCVGMFALAGCQAPTEPSKAGRFQVVQSTEYGLMRVDTETGETQLMVTTDRVPATPYFYATSDGKRLVWADIRHGNGF
jgi:hypothetical protein